MSSSDDIGSSFFDSEGSTTVEYNTSSSLKSRRPTLLMHVGPGKMGTTFLQCSFCTVEARDILLKDDYVYIGICTACKEKGVSALPRHSFFSDIVDDSDPADTV